jgi:glutaredoxin
MDKIAVIFSMKSCPFCSMLKEMLDKEDISYIDRDIEEFEEEIKYITKNMFDFVNNYLSKFLNIFHNIFKKNS